MPSAALSAAGTVASGVMGANAAGSASKAAQTANANTLNYVNGVYNTAEGNLQPTIYGGINAGNALAGLLGTGGNAQQSQQAWNNYLGSTNYNFLLNQGEQAVNTANAPAFNSGATAKALNNYAQGMAGNALSGYESLLQGQQQLGAQSAANLGSIGSSMAPTVNSSNNALAGAQGSAAVAQSNALGSMLGSLTGQSSFGGGPSSALSSIGSPGNGAGGFINAAANGNLGIGTNLTPMDTVTSSMPSATAATAFSGL